MREWVGFLVKMEQAAPVEQSLGIKVEKWEGAMFYGTLILAKKGPLAKVWLAAHWDKKLTKAHVFETDVESTVDNIISPGVKLALRTSGHLLLGVVRIYSRKQKYLIQDLGEACAKIKMAFRPGIIDLPSTTRADNSDSLALPEIFHDFSDSTAEMGVLQAQFTVNPSRVSEINIPDDIATDWRGFEEGNFATDEQLPGFTDIEIPRDEVSTDMAPNEISARDASSITVQKDTTKMDESSVLPNEMEFPDAVNDFGEPIDGALNEFMPLPDISEISGIDASKLDSKAEKAQDSHTNADMEVEEEGQDKEVAAENGVTGSEPEPMAVDEPVETLEELKDAAEPETVDAESPSKAVETSKVVESISKVGATPEKDKESNFVLEPVSMTPTTVERGKRKRRVVMDNDKEFSGQQIKSQFEDYNDLLQPKCFPPPTKKAMMWREMAGCEQLYSNPTFPGLSKGLKTMIKGNYSTSMEFADFVLDRSILDEITAVEPVAETAEPPQADVEDQNATITAVEPVTEPAADATVTEPAADATVTGTAADAIVTEPAADASATEPVADPTVAEPPPIDAEEQNVPETALDPIADAPELPPVDIEEQNMEPISDAMEPPQGDAEEQEQEQGSEQTDEESQRRWTKHTQQVVRVLDRNFKKTETVTFSSLTVKCDRKSAASQFYTCLLLAKEGIIDVHQLEPYAEISIQKGPKYVGTV